ncbi:ELKS/Rab6-interacting/CAST family member 1-like [Vespa velutina]|uniref:ELKS/Rab6-interacting/CAST family member 1-like n=1 Tax=Vespa velutina TaxID=202808 RepID=UPI001FB1FBCC|nr:ELKS/Rab6-interacting/CAST family member 1-like [Vespa velutina]
MHPFTGNTLRTWSMSQRLQDNLDELMKGVTDMRSCRKNEDDRWNENLSKNDTKRNLNDKRTKDDRDETIITWKKDLVEKNKRIMELEEEMSKMKDLLDNKKQVEKFEYMKDKNDDESWKKEVEAKNRRIVELEQVMASLENFLKEHTDTEGIRELEAIVERKNMRIDELEDTVAEFEDFLKENPDVKELHDLRHQVNVSERRIHELEDWIRRNDGTNAVDGIDRARIMELEEMVTHLEDYVRKHNVDILKQKLQDRESRIEQLQGRVDTLEKELIKFKKDFEGQKTSTESRKNHMKDSTNDPIIISNDARTKELELLISEKNAKIDELEKRIVESKDQMNDMQKDIARLEKELSEYEAEDIGVLKEEIRVRDERILQLEDEIDSLERAFNESVDLEQIEELMNVISRKQDKERQFEKDIESKKNRIEELSEALRESVVIATDGERRFQREEKLKKNALERVAKLEQRIVSIQTTSALKCPTCKPLLSKLQTSEKMLQRLTEERSIQLEDLHQMKQEALKAAVSEKDAHLALLELSGIKTAQQADQADKLKAERKKLIDRLKREDERSIEMSLETSPLDSDTTIQVLAEILETTEDEEKEEADENEDCVDKASSRKSEITTTNGDSCDHATMDSRDRECK